MKQFVQYQEEYVSSALNKKFAGVLSPGVYWGFEVEPGDGMNLSVVPGVDLPYSVAVVEREGYSITVRADEALTVPVGSSGTRYVCLEALYQLGSVGYQAVILRGAPESHHVKLARLTVPAGTTQITGDMIDMEQRDVGHPALVMLNQTALIMSLMASWISNQAVETRVAAIESHLGL